MDGCARAAKRKSDASIAHAWHVAVFGVRAYGGKLKSLDKYISVPKRRPQTNEEMLAELKAFQSRGVPMNIKKLH